MLPLEKFPKILGITFDPLLCFHKHAEVTADKCKQGLSILKALTGTDWRQQKETIVFHLQSESHHRLTHCLWGTYLVDQRQPFIHQKSTKGPKLRLPRLHPSGPSARRDEAPKGVGAPGHGLHPVPGRIPSPTAPLVPNRPS